jgi:hypothetical protein
MKVFQDMNELGQQQELTIRKGFPKINMLRQAIALHHAGENDFARTHMVLV